MLQNKINAGNDGGRDILVSFIIPVWNRQHTISYCLDSILSQCYHKCIFEVIIVDDYSTDASLSIIKKIISYIAGLSDDTNKDIFKFLPVTLEKLNFSDINSGRNMHSFIRVFCHNEHLGAAAARNTGLVHAVGKYIWFVDSDDIIAAGSIKMIENVLSDNHFNILRFQKQNISNIPKGYKLHDFQQNELIIKDVSNILDLLFLLSNGSVWNALFEREFIISFRFDTRFQYSEDSLFSWQSTLKASTAAYIPIPLYGYVLNPNSLTSVKPYERFACYIKVIEEYLDAINVSIKSLKDKKLLCKECEKRLYTHVFYIYEPSEITKDMWDAWYKEYYNIMILNKLRPLYKRAISFFIWSIHQERIIMLIFRLRYICGRN